MTIIVRLLTDLNLTHINTKTPPFAFNITFSHLKTPPRVVICFVHRYT